VTPDAGGEETSVPDAPPWWTLDTGVDSAPPVDVMIGAADSAPSDSDDASGSVGTFASVSAGYEVTCGVRTNGTIACWGDNYYGQATPPAGTFTSASVGGEWVVHQSHACGVRTDGTIACWGDNTYGQATPPPGTFASVSAALTYGLDGAVTCGV
jgi:hypothetical protein